MRSSSGRWRSCVLGLHNRSVHPSKKKREQYVSFLGFCSMTEIVPALLPTARAGDAGGAGGAGGRVVGGRHSGAGAVAGGAGC